MRSANPTLANCPRGGVRLLQVVRRVRRTLQHLQVRRTLQVVARLFARLFANRDAMRIALPFARYPIRKADRGAIPGAIRKVLRMSVPDLQGNYPSHRASPPRHKSIRPPGVQ